ncbi:MAG: hypothetical protein LPK45_02015, partial [Bacteroidota bacterium]|nr:hypothetical protein [Bacteroidota bacterium]MDX5429809.1 hypothetical protein [Bacteroidota bacterium]MDX5468588.1 hypothetical protein [Bacteroidota bacterium]
SEMKNANSGSASTTGGLKKTEMHFVARYEYIISILKNKEFKLTYALGLGASPYFHFAQADPVVSQSFPNSTIHTGVRLLLTPRVTYFFHSRFFIDLNIPVCVTDTYINRTKVENPSFTKTQQVYTTRFVDPFPEIFSGRVGLGYKF